MAIEKRKLRVISKHMSKTWERDAVRLVSTYLNLEDGRKAGDESCKLHAKDCIS
jgi:hypothetical protein